MKDRNIYLIGFMGVGKTSVSKELSRKLHIKVYEIDEIIQEEQGRSVSKIFGESGEIFFRKEETRILHQISNNKNCVVSTGGGIILKEENVEIMRKTGVIILLKATSQTIYNRLKDTDSRPILKDNMNVEFIQSLMDKRSRFYEISKDIEIITDDKSIGEICDDIIERLEINYED